jgi:hypothetical protein
MSQTTYGIIPSFITAQCGTTDEYDHLEPEDRVLGADGLPVTERGLRHCLHCAAEELIRSVGEFRVAVNRADDPVADDAEVQIALQRQLANKLIAKLLTMPSIALKH